MQNVFDYSQHFDDALCKIKSIRDPHAKLMERSDLGWDKVQQQQLTNIAGNDFDRYSYVVNHARKYTVNTICKIIVQLLYKRATYCKEVRILGNEDNGRSRIYLAFKDTRDDCLIIIKEMERDVGWINDCYVPDGIKKLMQDTGSKTYKYIYMLHDYAYLQIIGHNDDETDSSRGSNAYSLRWLFDTYFGNGEYDLFKAHFDNYRIMVDDYLGYTITRSLNVSALVNFRKIIEYSIKSFDYGQVLTKTICDHRNKQHWLKGPDEYQKIADQFFDQSIYKILLGDHSFSESLTTAEWLLDSMKKAHAVDLTVIGTGYFKAVEQLLFDLIKLYNPQFSQESTLGDCANFYKSKHNDLLRNDVHWSTKNFVYEAIFEYTNLRNRYFHKDNIHDWDRIEEIRTATFLLIFILLGCQNLTNDNLVELGLPDSSKYCDYSMLCEYINFHLGSLFCLEIKGLPEQWAVAVDSNGTKNAVCFKFIGTKQTVAITENDLPQRLWLGKINIPQAKDIRITDLVKEKLIFENGHFVGPSIVVEDGFTY